MSALRVPFEEASSIQPETVFTVFGLSITNAMLLGTIVTILLAVLCIYTSRRLRLKPSRFQLIIERLTFSFHSLTRNILGTEAAADAMLPLIGTLFLFFGISNIIALIPGLGSFTYNGVALFRTPTNDFNMTFSVALAMIVLTHVASLRTFGVFGHLGKFFKFKEVYLGFKQGFGPGMLSIVDFIIGLLDIVSELAKVFSLSLRLFGNMFAGEILAAVLLGAFAIAVPTIWLGMNLFVGILQAMVFGALTAAYYGLAIQKTEET
ncbi:MAG: hypothetical protein COY70_03320, partial [Candidatus Magasanikbacteria bacterium CG_4_10_14_0_8_um_filter_42_12]